MHLTYPWIIIPPNAMQISAQAKAKKFLNQWHLMINSTST